MEPFGRRLSGSSGPVTVIEHVVLFQLKEGYTEEQEVDMFKGLWSLKDRFSCIMAMSLGRVLAKNADDVTHALVMRFATKEALDNYMDDPYLKEVAQLHVVPYFNGELTADFETDVGSNLSLIFRDSDEFKEGVEHIEFFKVREGAPANEVGEFEDTLVELAGNVKTKVVQSVAGINFKPNQKYTHALVMHLPSVQGLAELIQDQAYVNCMAKIYSILDDHLRVDFLPDESIEKCGWTTDRSYSARLADPRQGFFKHDDFELDIDRESTLLRFITFELEHGPPWVSQRVDRSLT